MTSRSELHVSVLGPFPGSDADRLLGDDPHPDLAGRPHEGGYCLAPLVGYAVAHGQRRSVVSLSRSFTEAPQLFSSDAFAFYLAHRRTRHEIRSCYREERQHIVEALRQLQPDVVHANWTYLYALGALDSGRPMLVTVHDHARHMLRCLGPGYLGNYLITRRVLKRARFLTAVSPYVARYVARVAKRDVTVIPNAISPTLTSYLPPSGPSRPDAATVATIASALNASPFKNAKGGLKAFSRVKHAIPAAQYHLAGPGLDPNGFIAKWARRHGLADGVQFHGAIPHADFLTLLGRSAVLLHPSLEEACPGPPLEGMAMGKTVVVGAGCGACPWTIDDGKAGVLVNARSPRDMGERLIHVLQNPQDYAPQRAAAQQLVQSRYAPQAVADAYQALYERVHAEWPGPGS